MIRPAITQAAFDAIVEPLPFGSVSYKAEETADGGRFIWLERRALDHLDALRHPGEGYGDVILRLAGNGAAKPGRKRGS
jgi:hypothetical protein